jgi:hypothetical protein
LNSSGERILESLRQVAAERAARVSEPALAARVAAVKAYQHARFERDYVDLLADARYSSAARFFLEDLYGPADFADRDAQFVRIVPALVRLFPHEIVETVAELAGLHALSEGLDTAMARAPWAGELNPDRYGQAWRWAGQVAAREQQIALMVAVGSALDRYTRSLLLRQSLRVMRRPAQAAGLGALQQFLERGFDTFRAMRGAQDFLGLIAARERALAASLFAGGSGLVARSR